VTLSEIGIGNGNEIVNENAIEIETKKACVGAAATASDSSSGAECERATQTGVEAVMD
jgi:hypothetical protein